MGWCGVGYGVVDSVHCGGRGRLKMSHNTWLVTWWGLRQGWRYLIRAGRMMRVAQLAGEFRETGTAMWAEWGTVGMIRYRVDEFADGKPKWGYEAEAGGVVDGSRDGVVCAHMGKLGWVRWVVCKKLGGVVCVPHHWHTNTHKPLLSALSPYALILSFSPLLLHLATIHSEKRRHWCIMNSINKQLTKKAR